MSEEVWLVSYGQSDDREMTVAQIAGAMARGQITNETIVWRDGMGEWLPIEQSPVLKQALDRYMGRSTPDAEKAKPKGPLVGATKLGLPQANFMTAKPFGGTGGIPRVESLKKPPGASIPAPALKASTPNPPKVAATNTATASKTAATPAAASKTTAPRAIAAPTAPPPPMARSRKKTAIGLGGALGNLPRPATAAPPPPLLSPDALREDSKTPVAPATGSTMQRSDQKVTPRSPAVAPRAPIAAKTPLATTPRTPLVAAKATAPVAAAAVAVEDTEEAAPISLSEHALESVPSGKLPKPEESDAEKDLARIIDDLSSDAPVFPAPPPVIGAEEEPETISLDSGSMMPIPDAADEVDLPTLPPAASSGTWDRPSEDELPTLPLTAHLFTPPTQEARNASAAQASSPASQPLAEQNLPVDLELELESVPLSGPLSVEPITQRNQKSSRGTVLPIIGALLVLLAAFAFWMMERTETPQATEPVTALPKPEAASAPMAPEHVPAEPAPPPTQASPEEPTPEEAPTAEAPAPEPAPTEAPPKATPPPVAAKPSSPTAASVVSKPEPKPAVTPPAPPPPAATPVTPPPKVNPNAPPFDRNAAAAAVGTAAQEASTCRKPGDPSGVARVSVTFSNSGRAARATVSGPPFAGTATGSCIAATMRKAQIPEFSGERTTVQKTVVIR